MENFEENLGIVKQLKSDMKTVIFGQDELIDAIIIASITNNHVLIEGLPGLAKTKSVKTLADLIYGNPNLDKNYNPKLKDKFKRNSPIEHVQFVPDMQPSDIIGGMRIGENIIKKNDRSEEQKETIEPKKYYGPVFTHLFIADEINRAPSKVQSALLQVMQTKQVSIVEFGGSEDYVNIDGQEDTTLFSVFATQNPIEEEGTYPLSAAFLDRFLFKINVMLPSPKSLKKIAQSVSDEGINKGSAYSYKYHQQCQVDGKKIPPYFGDDKGLNRFRDLVSQVKNISIAPHIQSYAEDIVTATNGKPSPPPSGKLNVFSNLAKSDVYDYLADGVSPRALESLLRASRGYAVMHGRTYVLPADIRAVAFLVLNHRLRLTFEAMSLKDNSLSLEHYIVDEILDNIKLRGCDENEQS